MEPLPPNHPYSPHLLGRGRAKEQPPSSTCNPRARVPGREEARLEAAGRASVRPQTQSFGDQTGPPRTRWGLRGRHRLEQAGGTQGWSEQSWALCLHRTGREAGRTPRGPGLRLLGHLLSLPWPSRAQGCPPRCAVGLKAGGWQGLGAGVRAPRGVIYSSCCAWWHRRSRVSGRKYGSAFPNPHFLSRQHARAPGA